MASQLRWPHVTSLLLWEPQISDKREKTWEMGTFIQFGVSFLSFDKQGLRYVKLYFFFCFVMRPELALPLWGKNRNIKLKMK
jgi:hypothetical protein